MWLEGLGKLKKIHFIGTRTRDLPARSIVPQPTTLQRTPYKLVLTLKIILFEVELLSFISYFSLEIFSLINLNFERSSLI
jgi:hypothetical protein